MAWLPGRRGTREGTRGKAVFIHQRLRAYHHALAFYKLVKTIRKAIPRGLGSIGDQLTHASQSIVLNIAEGAASRFPDVKRRHHAGERLATAREQLEAAAALTFGLAR